MTDFTPVASLIGGALIGLAAASLLLTHGRIAGITGIIDGLLGRDVGAVAARAQRLAFVLGLVLGGVGILLLSPEAFGTGDASLPVVGVAGLLVGYGTRLGNGCTSGHGVCGVARFSRRSIVATATFCATGALTVFIVRHVIGGAS